MSSREGLRLARAIKQQLVELRAGRAAPNALAAAVELHTWTRKRISPEEEADRQPLSPALHRCAADAWHGCSNGLLLIISAASMLLQQPVLPTLP